MDLLYLVFSVIFLSFFYWFFGIWLIGSSFKEHIYFFIRGVKRLRRGKFGQNEMVVHFILTIFFFIFSIFIVVFIRSSGF